MCLTQAPPPPVFPFRAIQLLKTQSQILKVIVLAVFAALATACSSPPPPSSCLSSTLETAKALMSTDAVARLEDSDCRERKIQGLCVCVCLPEYYINENAKLHNRNGAQKHFNMKINASYRWRWDIFTFRKGLKELKKVLRTNMKDQDKSSCSLSSDERTWLQNAKQREKTGSGLLLLTVKHWSFTYKCSRRGWIKTEKEGGGAERHQISAHSAGSGSRLDSSADRFKPRPVMRKHELYTRLRINQRLAGRSPP